MHASTSASPAKMAKRAATNFSVAQPSSERMFLAVRISIDRGYAYNSNAYFTDYRNWSQTTLDTIRSTLRAAGLQNAQLQSEQTVLAGLRSMSQGAQGRMEALQVMDQISEQQVEQLMKLRELMLADLQSKQAYQATEGQEKAAINAAVEQFFKYSRDSGDGYTVQSGWR